LGNTIPIRRAAENAAGGNGQQDEEDQRNVLVLPHALQLYAIIAPAEFHQQA